MKPRVRKLPVGWWVSGEGWCPTKGVLDHCLAKPERPGWSGAMSALRGMRADWLTFRACRLLVKAYKLDRGPAREAAVRAVASEVTGNPEAIVTLTAGELYVLWQSVTTYGVDADKESANAKVFAAYKSLGMPFGWDPEDDEQVAT